MIKVTFWDKLPNRNVFPSTSSAVRRSNALRGRSFTEESFAWRPHRSEPALARRIWLGPVDQSPAHGCKPLSVTTQLKPAIITENPGLRALAERAVAMTTQQSYY